VLLMLGQGAVLLTTPFWLSHFAAFTAAMVALTAGAATGRLIALIRAGPLRIAVGAILAAVLLGYASGWRTVIFGGPFSQGVPSDHRRGARLCHLRRSDRPRADRLIEPQPAPRLPIDRGCRRQFPRPGSRFRTQSIAQPQPSVPALRTRLLAYWFGDHIAQILRGSGLQYEDDCRS
jgi:hypothetical protein